jgi:hypothetical protein
MRRGASDTTLAFPGSIENEVPTGAVRAFPTPRRKAAPKEINPAERFRIVDTIAEWEKAMRNARNILGLILRFISAEPVFSTHSRFVI